MNTDPIYEADGKISVRKAVPFGLQHVLAMFVANIAPILIVTGVVKMPASEAGAVVQAAMIIAGIGSLLQMYPVFRLGSGLPVIMGISFTFVSVFCVIGLKYGYGAILGAVLIFPSGIFIIPCGFCRSGRMRWGRISLSGPVVRSFIFDGKEGLWMQVRGWRLLSELQSGLWRTGR